MRGKESARSATKTVPPTRRRNGVNPYLDIINRYIYILYVYVYVYVCRYHVFYMARGG